MEPVGVFRRAVAVIIDTILLMIVAYALAAATGSTSDQGFNLQGAPALLLFLIFFGYYVVMEKTSGGTLGKKAMGLVVVKKDGEQMSWGAAIIRNLLRIIDGIAGYLVGAIAIWVSKDKQRLGDMAAGTLVVRAEK
ncbi:MAG TPA: RDD family protein [Usitatibacter sp.]|nr:RDD family protein [Usitatibacter sp.]